MMPEEVVMRTLVTLLIATLLIAVPSEGSSANPEHQTKSYLDPSSPDVPRDLRKPNLSGSLACLRGEPRR
jgi:hypothetical protein